MMPVGDGRRGAVVLGHLGQVGLDLMPTRKTDDDQPHALARNVSERHRA